MIAPGAPLLSPRGKVLDNGMPRFFRRLAEGRFDEDDIRQRAQELADFVEEARAHYGIAPPIALGYSNGANIAAALLLLHPSLRHSAAGDTAVIANGAGRPGRQAGPDRFRRQRPDDDAEGAAQLAARLQQWRQCRAPHFAERP